ncbi:hypothetical protein RRG08_044616 [Elysia crispata]|uniref:Uncharacterized protein n=1 Tax=Elysia crispata TaxID=231223 RepID=A0AAE1D1A2_9GAST|nr:hypothetical protein RRG08_044616 [Elysia crispata]
MRPAVHASILSQRTQSNSRHRANQRHQFSGRRLLIMVLCGILLFIPGLVLTIVGLEATDKGEAKLDSRVQFVYRAVGPLMCTVGSLVMFASCIYFYCYGTGPQGPGGQHDIEHDGASGSKGSSGRSKSHHSSHHSHHHSQSSHHQSQHHHHHNGRAVDVMSGDGDCRLSLRSETAHSTDTSSGPSSHHQSKNNRRSTGMAAAAEEEVPLAQMEDSFDLGVKGQQRLKVPQVTIQVQEPSDSDMDIDYADDISGSLSLSNGTT